MSDDRTMLLLLKGHISELPPEQQAEIQKIREQIKQIVAGSDLAVIALGLVSAELSVETT